VRAQTSENFDSLLSNNNSVGTKMTEAKDVRLGLPLPLSPESQDPTEQPSDVHMQSDFLLCLEDNGSLKASPSQFLAEFQEDLKGQCTRENLSFLLAAGSVSFAFHEWLDDDVAENTARHANRWGNVQDFFGGIGNPVHQLAAISGLYTYSLIRDDTDMHELSKSLLNAVTITVLTTTTLKFAANTTRPNGDPNGWPSGHTSSSFAFATVLDQYYGPRLGIPAYALASLVAWERIDDREHDLSDVVFGAALGYAIGRTVAREHQIRFGGLQIEPFVDPTAGTTGMAIEWHH